MSVGTRSDPDQAPKDSLQTERIQAYLARHCRNSDISWIPIHEEASLNDQIRFEFSGHFARLTTAARTKSFALREFGGGEEYDVLASRPA